MIAGALVLLGAVVTGSWQWQRSRVRPPSAAGRLMLAVLPFENLTGDAAQDYLSDGLTEEIISQLGHLDPQLFGVIARTSAMHYKHTQERLDQVGRELSVQYVLEGSVRRDSDKLRVSAQLIRVLDETHVWVRQYDRPLTGLLDLQEEIAFEISGQIQLIAGYHKSSPPTTRAYLLPERSEAYDLYLQGLYFWNQRAVEGLRHATDYFKQATAKDPNHARAYAGIADCYALLGGYSGEPRAAYMTSARSAALRALEIDETLPEAHTALAVIVQNYDRDWQTAEREYRRAIELNPNYATAHHWYAEHLGFLGRFQEAFRESERARQLDPLSLIISADNGMLLYYSRHFDRAIETFRSISQLDPNFPRARNVIFAYTENRLYADALAQAEAMRRLDPEDPWSWSSLAFVHGRSGQLEQAQTALEKLILLNRTHQVDPGAIARAYLGMGKKNETMAWLEKAYIQHSDTMTTLKVDPVFDPLRSDPRFQALMRRVGLTP
jgi:TolB-like protein/Tfp pilus assembly protein PilF